MNNSEISIDEEKKETSNQRKSELVKIITAIRNVQESDDWQFLKKSVLDGVVETLERQVKTETQKDEINPANLYRLQGQLAWAKRYADLSKLEEFFNQQLTGIKLNEQNNSADGAA